MLLAEAENVIVSEALLAILPIPPVFVDALMFVYKERCY
jgi:hypothetical protein